MNEDLIKHVAEMMEVGRRAVARAEERMIEKKWPIVLLELDLAIDSFEQVVAQLINAAPSRKKRRVKTEHEHEVETRGGGMPMN